MGGLEPGGLDSDGERSVSGCGVVSDVKSQKPMNGAPAFLPSAGVRFLGFASRDGSSRSKSDKIVSLPYKVV